MTHGRSRSRVGVLVAAMVAGLLTASVGQPAAAQDRLPGDLVSAGALSAEQQNLVNLYADFWTGILRGADPSTSEQVVVARSRLIEPLNQPSASDAFLRLYRPAVSSRLQGALDNPNLVARLNTMILVSRLGMNADVIALISRGLNDQSPAVRYWAVKAIRAPFQPGASGAAAGAQPDAAAGRQLLVELEQVLADEAVLEVIEQVLLAMVDLDTAGNDALERVVSVLNRRVALHLDRPDLPYRPETSGMQAVYRRILFAQQSRGVNQLLDRTAAAAAKYMFLLARQAQGAELSPELQADYAAMADLSYTILTQIRNARGVTTGPVASQFQFSQDLANRNWDAVRHTAQQFRDMLTSAPFNLDPTDVTVTQ